MQVFSPKTPRAALCLVVLSAAAFAADPPQLTIEAPREAPMVGQPFAYSVQVRWPGPQDAFVVYPEDAAPLDWGTARWTQGIAQHAGNESRLDYTLEVTPTASGDFDGPLVSITYYDQSARPAPESNTAEAASAMPPTMTLSAEAPVIRVREDLGPLYRKLFLALGALGVVIAGVSLWVGLRRRAAPPTETLSPWATQEEALHNARRHRLDGDYYKHYLELVRVAEFAGGAVEVEFAEKFRRKAQETGYQGRRPADDELEGDLKDLERALARLKEEEKS